MMSVFLRFFCIFFFSSIPFFSLAHAEKNQTFRFRLTEDMGTLDWNYGELNSEIVYQLMEGLFTADQLGRPEPAVAEYFSWSNNQTVITIYLRPNLYWSDGEPLCASDFVRSWERLKSKKFASPYAHYANIIKKSEANSCNELKVFLSRRAPEFPALLTHYVFFPLHKKVTEKLASKIFTNGVGIPVNGPFLVEAWEKNQKIVLARNHRYREKIPEGAISKIETFFIPEDNTGLSFFEQKRIDWLKDISVLSRKKGLEKKLQFFPSLTAFYLGLNATSSTLLKDKNLRIALSASLNREELAKVLGKEIQGTNIWLLPTFGIHGTKKMKQKQKFIAIETAKKTFSKLVNENKFDLRLRIYNKNIHKLLAEWLQEQWRKKLGILVPIDIQEEKVYWKEIISHPAPIFLSGVTAPYNHPRAFLQEFLSASSANWTGWKSSEYDKYVEQGKAYSAEKLLLNDGFVIPLYSRESVALVQDGWRNFWINPLGQVYLKNIQFQSD